jgi:hypothetical protein
MAAATQRIPVLVTPAEKKAIAKKAAAAGVSMGEYLRQAAKSYNGSREEEETALLRMVELLERRSAEVRKRVDEILAFCDASDRRIEALEASAGRVR